MTIPTDNVDEEQLQRPAHWDTRFIRRFMIFFGPISSIFDFATFGIMIWVFNAPCATVPIRLVRRVPRNAKPDHLRDPHTPRPVLPQQTQHALAVATTICVAIGVALPFSPLAHVLGFTALPAGFLGALAAMILIYLALVELGSSASTCIRASGPAMARPLPDREHRIHHRASRWTTHARPRPVQSSRAAGGPWPTPSPCPDDFRLTSEMQKCLRVGLSVAAGREGAPSPPFDPVAACRTRSQPPTSMSRRQSRSTGGGYSSHSPLAWMHTSLERPGPSLVNLLGVFAGTITTSPGAGRADLVFGLEVDGAVEHEPGLVVGVAVEFGPLSGVAAVEDQRDGGPVLDAFDRVRIVWACLDHSHALLLVS